MDHSMNAHIIGIEYHLPERVESVQDLQSQNPDWDLQKLTGQAGIHSRHVAEPGQTASDLGFLAGQKLLGQDLVPRGEIDFLVYCTQTPDQFIPPAACTLQDRLGLSRDCGALDVNLGCSGYVYGLYLAKAMIQSGLARNVLLITADTLNKVVHPRDRMLRVLFGDAGAATLVSPGESPGLGTFLLGTNGQGAGKLIIPAGGFRMPKSPETAAERTDNAGCVRTAENLYMDGPAIFTFAITVVPRLIKQLLAKAGLTAEQIDFYVYHQANEFMLRQLAKRNGVPDEKLVLEIADVGNTASVSIPIAIRRRVESGQIVPGKRLALIGFGVGFSWAACELTWG